MMTLPYAVMGFHLVSARFSVPLPSGLWMTAACAAAVLNMVWPFYMRARGCAARQLLFWDLLIKLVQFPLVAWCLIVLWILTKYQGDLQADPGSHLWPTLAVMVLEVLRAAVILALPVLLAMELAAASMYGVNGLLQAEKEGAVSRRFRILHTVLHFVAALDVVSAVWSYVHVRRKEIEP